MTDAQRAPFIKKVQFIKNGGISTNSSNLKSTHGIAVTKIEESHQQVKNEKERKTERIRSLVKSMSFEGNRLLFLSY